MGNRLLLIFHFLVPSFDLNLFRQNILLVWVLGVLRLKALSLVTWLFDIVGFSIAYLQNLTRTSFFFLSPHNWWALLCFLSSSIWYIFGGLVICVLIGVTWESLACIKSSHFFPDLNFSTNHIPIPPPPPPPLPPRGPTTSSRISSHKSSPSKVKRNSLAAYPTECVV